MFRGDRERTKISQDSHRLLDLNAGQMMNSARFCHLSVKADDGIEARPPEQPMGVARPACPATGDPRSTGFHTGIHAAQAAL